MGNIILISAVMALITSQMAKAFVGIARYGRTDFLRTPWRLIWAGGMPSSHSAFTVAPLTVVGIKEGLGSPLFGLGFLITCIAIYDRGRMFHIYSNFQKRFPDLKKEVEKDPKLKDLIGHSALEITFGIVIGFVSGLLAYFFTPSI